MEDKMKKLYEAPQLTVAVFKTERGYGSSVVSANGLALFSTMEFGTGDQNLEDRGTATEWTW